MAKIKCPLGKISGRVGKYVYYQLNGETYIRKAPEKKEREPTPKQKVQRKKMMAAVSLWRASNDTPIRKPWNVLAKKMKGSGYNLFVSNNIHAFNEEGLVIDYEKISVSKGHLDIPALLRYEVISDNSLRFTWIYRNDNFSGAGDDILHVFMMYNDDTFRNLFFSDPAFTRSSGEVNVTLPEEDRHPMHVYCYFGSRNGKLFSSSKYMKIDWR